LDDIDAEIAARKSEEARIDNERKQKLQVMKDAYEKVQEFLKDVSLEKSKKDLARQRFLQFFSENLAWTNEDENMRNIVSINLEIEFMFADGGTFLMGVADTLSDPKSIHSVIISRFNISKTEITFMQYDRYCEATGKEKPSDNGWGRGKRPAINVSWDDAIGFCKWASNFTGTTIRLPYEAEWEFAARGGKKSHGSRFSGSNSIESVGWYRLNAGNQTHDVATKQANELGIYDLTGNVWEWCQDWYDVNYYKTAPTNNPKGPSIGTYRALRGGAWANSDAYVLVGTRNSNPPDRRSTGIGFRVVQELH
jgi:formylglycine-generating enzyme required for sulfatase activity